MRGAMLQRHAPAARKQSCANKTGLQGTKYALWVPRARPVEQQARTRCQASAAGALELLAPAASTALSTYQLSRPAQLFSSSTRVWFEAMVQTIVKQLDGTTPILLKVAFQPMLQLNLVRLAPSELLQGWPALQQQHFASAPSWDAVVLVHPVSSQQQPCVVSQVQGEPCSGCPHTAPASSAHYSSSDTELLHGKLGDCCSDSSHSHHHDDAASQPSPAAAAAAAAEGGGSAAPHSHHHQHQHHQHQQEEGSSSQVSYYGVVVQCRDAADPLQGCYLLKTMQVKQHSGGGSGCHCTHYSLNRVCLGPSLSQQYQAAWLV